MNPSYAHGASSASWRTLGCAEGASLLEVAQASSLRTYSLCRENFFQVSHMALKFFFMPFNADVYELRSAPQDLSRRAEPHSSQAEQSLPHRLVFFIALGIKQVNATHTANRTTGIK